MSTLQVTVKDGYNGHKATVTATANESGGIIFTTESGSWYRSGIEVNMNYSEKNRLQLSIHNAMKTGHSEILGFRVVNG